MKNKQFKRETKLYITIGKENFSATDWKGAKKVVYQRGRRNYIYEVCEYDREGIILNKWLFKYTKEGTIFTKQIYNRWKEEKTKAKQNQYNLF